MLKNNELHIFSMGEDRKSEIIVEKMYAMYVSTKTLNTIYFSIEEEEGCDDFVYYCTTERSVSLDSLSEKAEKKLSNDEVEKIISTLIEDEEDGFSEAGAVLAEI